MVLVILAMRLKVFPEMSVRNRALEVTIPVMFLYQVLKFLSGFDPKMQFCCLAIAYRYSEVGGVSFSSKT